MRIRDNTTQHNTTQHNTGGEKPQRSTPKENVRCIHKNPQRHGDNAQQPNWPLPSNIQQRLEVDGNNIDGEPMKKN